MFLVPYNKLTDEQKGIIRRFSRQPSNLFVKGPPGSGKTLISLYTIRDMVQNQVTTPLVLIYNHSLYGYLSSSFKELGLSDNITIATKDKFFWSLAREHRVQISGDSYEEKYDALLSELAEKSLKCQWDIAIIDEVQDLNKKEWLLLKKIASRITSMGDFDQKMYRSDLEEKDVSAACEIEKLFDIFRFSKNIAKLAGKFSRNHNEDESGLERKVIKIDQKQVQLIDTEAGREADEISMIIETLSQQQGNIGIIGPSKKQLAKMAQELNDRDIDVTFYKSNKDFGDHDFTSTQPLLITCFSAKGLEFENVIVFGFYQDNYFVQDFRRKDRLTEMLYVSLTRANTGLYILRTPNTIPELKELSQEIKEESPELSLDDLFG